MAKEFSDHLPSYHPYVSERQKRQFEQDRKNYELYRLVDANHYDRLAEMEKLLQDGANPNHKSVYVTTFCKAVRNSNIEIIKLLVTYGASQDALFQNEVDSLHKLIGENVDLAAICAHFA